MKTSVGVGPWWLTLFLVVWVLTMAYVGSFFFTVVRIRRLTGEARGPDDWINVWRDPMTVRYLRWVFSARHRAIKDPTLSRMVMIVRGLVICDLPAVLLTFATLPWYNR